MVKAAVCEPQLAVLDRTYSVPLQHQPTVQELETVAEAIGLVLSGYERPVRDYLVRNSSGKNI